MYSARAITPSSTGVCDFAAEQGAGGGHHGMQGEVVVQGFGIDGGIHVARRQQGLEAGGEAQAAVVQAVVQGLDAQAVPGQEQGAGQPVPDGEGEGAVQAGDAVVAPFRVGPQDHLGIAVGMENVTLADQFGAQLGIVVDGAVEHQGQAGGRVHHGLAGAVGQVDDGQAPVAQGGGAVEMQTLAVRPAPGEAGHHAFQGRRLGSGAVEAEFTGDAAHGVFP